MFKRILFSVILLMAAFLGYSQSGPVPTFGNFYPSRAGTNKSPTTADILAIGGLSTTIPEYRITSFVFSMRPSQSDYIGPIQVSGSEFSDDVKKKIRMYAGVSGTIYFEEIKGIDRDRRQRGLSPIILKYKNN